MLIPSIDLQGGEVVQLVRGEAVALRYADPGPWIERFSSFSRVQLIDLDAAKGTGDNRALVTHIAERLPVQLGGGIRTPAAAREMLRLGAQAVILGSALFQDDAVRPVRVDVAAAFAEEVGAERLIFGVDSAAGRVAVRGWRSTVPVSAEEAMQQLAPHCSAFLYTHIDVEGTMTGFPLERARQLRRATANRLIVAGGIRSWAEIEELERCGADAVVGMAVYRNLLPLIQGNG